jgi:hypothetical protein
MSALETADVVAPASNLLPGLVQRPPELGRIRMGEKSEKGFPVKLKTFRLTSGSKALLDAAAALYGGQVKEWKDAPDEGMWQLVTAASELDILIPASLAVIGQSYELWKGGTAERRCDGTTEAIGDQPCVCAAKGLTGADRECDIVTRLRVMLPRVPGLGVWRLDTGGWFAATTLPSTVTLLARLTPGQWIPAVLRAEQRSKKERDDKGKVMTHRFVVPVLDLPGTTIGQIVGGAPADTPLLEEGEPARPPTAAEKAAQRRAELEAQTMPTEASDGVSRKATDASMESVEAGAPADPQNPSLPLPRGQCNVASPHGDDCRLPLGHEGDHQAVNKRWPTPKQTERPPASDGEAGQDEGAANAPAAPDVTAQAAEIFEGEFVDETSPDVQAGLDLIPANHRRGQ